MYLVVGDGHSSSTLALLKTKEAKFFWLLFFRAKAFEKEFSRVGKVSPFAVLRWSEKRKDENENKQTNKSFVSFRGRFTGEWMRLEAAKGMAVSRIGSDDGVRGPSIWVVNLAISFASFRPLSTWDTNSFRFKREWKRSNEEEEKNSDFNVRERESKVVCQEVKSFLIACELGGRVRDEREWVGERRRKNFFAWWLWAQWWELDHLVVGVWSGRWLMITNSLD